MNLNLIFCFICLNLREMGTARGFGVLGFWVVTRSLSRRSPRVEAAALPVRKLVGHDPVSGEK